MQSWLNDTTYLQVGRDGPGTVISRAEAIAVDDSSVCSQDSVPLIPVTERQNLSPIANTDGDEVAFLSRHGDVLSLFVVPAAGGDPRQVVSELPTDPNEVILLIDWT